MAAGRKLPGKNAGIRRPSGTGVADAPHDVTLKGKRDRAILATLLYHALRREELCKLTVKDFRHERRGVAHLKVSGKGGMSYAPQLPPMRLIIRRKLQRFRNGWGMPILRRRGFMTTVRPARG